MTARDFGPAYTFEADVDTGVFMDINHNLGFVVNGVRVNEAAFKEHMMNPPSQTYDPMQQKGWQTEIFDAESLPQISVHEKAVEDIIDEVLDPEFCEKIEADDAWERSMRGIGNE